MEYLLTRVFRKFHLHMRQENLTNALFTGKFDMAAGRLDAFPIDTWVEKILSRAYQLENWKLPQLQDFSRIHFGTTAGYAQQYLFAAARAGIIPA